MPASTIERSPNTAEARDRALELGFVKREAWAFESAYHAFKSLLFAAAVHVMRDREEAEDCVHDVLVRLWQRGHAYRVERGSLRAFLIVCVRNEALSRARKLANRQRIERTNVRPATIEPQDNQVAAGDLIDRLLQSLGEKQREAIRLSFNEDLSYQEIALRLGEPVGTIKSRLSNAVRTLRAHLLAQGDHT